MGIIAKNIIIGKTEEKPSPPLISTNIFNKLKQQNEPVKQEVVETKVENTTEKYKHVHEGDLHKLINNKSDYLSDMLDLKNNK